MKISLQWLNQYVDLSDKSVDEIVDGLTFAGLEVEEVEAYGLPPLEKVVVGEVLSREQHPDADRLGVCRVNVGAEEALEIVCGASNYTVGDRVPVALVGAELPGGFKIKKSKLRGVASYGMMCSARELGLGADHEGLLILEQRPEVGTPLNDVFTENDTVFDVAITPNRPDCLSHLGVARELAALYGLELRYPEVPGPEHTGEGGALASVTVEVEEDCPHYRAYSVRGVKVGPSPDWLRGALQTIGLRPVNNVVDVTNYVLHELGQPLHAFDAKKIEGGSLLIRHAHRGEKITTLDGKERALQPSMPVIADRQRALVVAGVMGSVEAEVDDATTDVVLESAFFNPSAVRKTARTLGLSTDSSYRFERGVDPRGAEYAALRALDLLVQVAGGEIQREVKVAGEPPFTEYEITLLPGWVRDRLGFELEDGAMKAALESLEMTVHEHDSAEGPFWQVSIPSFRVDLERPIDLMEEILRIHGTRNIPTSTVQAPALLREDAPLSVYERQAAAYLVGRHYNECWHYTLREEDEVQKWSSHTNAGTLALANPLASDQSHLRPSLLLGLLDCLRLNRARAGDPRQLFETGRVFREKDGQVYELFSVAFVRVAEPEKEGWLTREKPDFFTLKAETEALLALAGVPATEVAFEAMDRRHAWQPGHSAQAGDYHENGWEARVGLVHLPMLAEWDLGGVVLCGSLYFDAAFFEKAQTRARPRYEAFSAYPPSRRDLALVVEDTVPAEAVRARVEDIARKAAAAAGFTCESVFIFDVFAKPGGQEGRKSIAFGLVFRSPERTLQEKELQQVFEQVQREVAEGTGYTVRA